LSVKRRQFCEEFKSKVLQDVSSGKSVAEVTRKYNLSKNSIYEWKNAADARGATVSLPQSELSALQAKVADLERLVGRLSVENDVLKKVERHRQGKEGQS
jgi:transposase